MAKQIFVSYSPTGTNDSDALFLSLMAERINTAMGGPKPISMMTGSAYRLAQVTIGDAEVSQDAANALAQGIFDATTGDDPAGNPIAPRGPISPKAAEEVNAGGVHTMLTTPTPA